MMRVSDKKFFNKKFNNDFDLRLVKNNPCLLISDWLIISDIHLGFEHNLLKKGIMIPSRTKLLIEKLRRLQARTKAKNLLVLGDLKDSYNRINKSEWKDVPVFLRYCSENFKETIITKGNHDGMLEKLNLFENVKIFKQVIFEFKDKKIGFIHGHSWPDKFLIEECEIIIMGHSHPSYVFNNHLGQLNTMSAWFISEVNKLKLRKNYPSRLNKVFLEKIIIVPCFNDFFNGSDEKLGPLMMMMKNTKKILLNLEIIN